MALEIDASALSPREAIGACGRRARRDVRIGRGPGGLRPARPQGPPAPDERLHEWLRATVQPQARCGDRTRRELHPALVSAMREWAVWGADRAHTPPVRGDERLFLL